MSKYKFNLIERQSLWEAHDKKCFYCGELVYFRELHIDHIVPENLINNESKLKDFISESGLPNTFEINSYVNWVPCHSRCNKRKGGEMFELHTTLYYLDLARRKIEKIRRIESSINSKLHAEKLSFSIALALSENKISASEIKDLLAQYDKDKAKFKLLSELEFVNRVYRNWISQGDFTELLKQPVKTGSPENDGVSLTGPDDSEIINVKTCEEYFDYIKKGFYARTTYDMKMEAFFERTCGLIKAIGEATIPTFNYISDSKVSINNFELLPLSLFKSFVPDTRRQIKSLEGLTFQDWIDNGNFEIIEQFENGFKIVHSGEGLLMIELLRADLNNDNVEDVLVHCYSFATGGTLGVGYNNILSRQTTESKFKEIKSLTNNV